jgi:hypothetical protein
MMWFYTSWECVGNKSCDEILHVCMYVCKLTSSKSCEEILTEYEKDSSSSSSTNWSGLLDQSLT